MTHTFKIQRLVFAIVVATMFAMSDACADEPTGPTITPAPKSDAAVPDVAVPETEVIVPQPGEIIINPGVADEFYNPGNPGRQYFGFWPDNDPYWMSRGYGYGYGGMGFNFGYGYRPLGYTFWPRYGDYTDFGRYFVDPYRYYYQPYEWQPFWSYQRYRTYPIW